MRRILAGMVGLGLAMLAGCSWFGGGQEATPAVIAAPETRPGEKGPTTGPVAMTKPAGKAEEAATAPASAPAEVARTGGQYFVVIASYAKAENAQAAAKYLTEHGVPAQVMAGGKAGVTMVVSTERFAGVKEAEPLRQKIVEIGKKHPAGKDGKSVWYDAYVKQGKK